MIDAVQLAPLRHFPVGRLSDRHGRLTSLLALLHVVSLRQPKDARTLQLKQKRNV